MSTLHLTYLHSHPAAKPEKSENSKVVRVSQQKCEKSRKTSGKCFGGGV